MAYMRAPRVCLFSVQMDSGFPSVQGLRASGFTLSALSGSMQPSAAGSLLRSSIA